MLDARIVVQSGTQNQNGREKLQCNTNRWLWATPGSGNSLHRSRSAPSTEYRVPELTDRHGWQHNSRVKTALIPTSKYNWGNRIVTGGVASNRGKKHSAVSAWTRRMLSAQWKAHNFLLSAPHIDVQVWSQSLSVRSEGSEEQIWFSRSKGQRVVLWIVVRPVGDPPCSDFSSRYWARLWLDTSKRWATVPGHCNKTTLNSAEIEQFQLHKWSIEQKLI